MTEPGVTAMRVAHLWRYPVKSLRGEELDASAVGLDGVAGDRLVHVLGPTRVITARTRPRLLGLRGGLSPEGAPLIEGRPWDAPESLAAVRGAAGDDAELVFYDGTGPQRYDVLPLTVVTDGALAAFGHDYRRLRPNLVIAGVEGMAERTWVGRQLRIGELVIEVVKPRARCVMTTFHPDTLEQDPDVLREINARFGQRIALDCRVVRPGRVRRGDPVELEPALTQGSPRGSG